MLKKTNHFQDTFCEIITSLVTTPLQQLHEEKTQVDTTCFNDKKPPNNYSGHKALQFTETQRTEKRSEADAQPHFVDRPPRREESRSAKTPM